MIETPRRESAADRRPSTPRARFVRGRPWSSIGPILPCLLLGACLATGPGGPAPALESEPARPAAGTPAREATDPGVEAPRTAATGSPGDPAADPTAIATGASTPDARRGAAGDATAESTPGPDAGAGAPPTTPAPNAVPATATLRRVTATPEPPSRGTELPEAVDWPTLPELEGREPIDRTRHFRVFTEPEADPDLGRLARRWTPELEPLLAEVSERLGGRLLPKAPVDLVFVTAYTARCPARGLAATYREPPLLLIFVDAATDAIQIRAVLAHEMAHHLSMDAAFVGDGVLTEGIANWAAGRHALAWQGIESWDAAVRGYLSAGSYVSITDDSALRPRPGEACIARRDRIYNIRTAFVGWLIGRVGLERVLAMPALELVLPGADGKTETRRLPDYSAATGFDLAALERLWLRQLRATTPIEAW